MLYALAAAVFLIGAGTLYEIVGLRRGLAEVKTRLVTLADGFAAIRDQVAVRPSATRPDKPRA